MTTHALSSSFTRRNKYMYKKKLILYSLLGNCADRHTFASSIANIFKWREFIVIPHTSLQKYINFLEWKIFEPFVCIFFVILSLVVNRWDVCYFTGCTSEEFKFHHEIVNKNFSLLTGCCFNFWIFTCLDVVRFWLVELSDARLI